MERLRDECQRGDVRRVRGRRRRGRVFQGFTAPVRDDRGGFLGRIWTLREVTQQRELDRLKDEFVATVSHELRTPLTSMMGFLEMIREGEAGELNEEQQRFLSIVYRSSERLQRLVGDLLFVARLDANGLQLQFAETRVDELVARGGRVVRRRSPAAREIELSTLEIEEVPPIWGDRERLASCRQPDLERDQVHARRAAPSPCAPRAGDDGRGRSRSRTAASAFRVARAGSALPAVLPLLDRDRAGDSRAPASGSSSRRRSPRRTAARSPSAPRPARARASASSCRSTAGASDARRRARRRLVVGARRRLRRARRTPSRATRTSPTTDLDADRLVEACRAVLGARRRGRRARDLELLALARRTSTRTTGR